MPQTIAPIDPFQRITGIRLSLGGWYLRTVTALTTSGYSMHAWDSTAGTRALLGGRVGSSQFYFYDGTSIAGPLDSALDPAIAQPPAWIASANQIHWCDDNRHILEWQAPSGPWTDTVPFNSFIDVFESPNFFDEIRGGDRNAAGDRSFFLRFNNGSGGIHEVLEFASGGAMSVVTTGPTAGSIALRDLRCLSGSGDILVRAQDLNPRHLWRYDGSWTDTGAFPFSGNSTITATSTALFAVPPTVDCELYVFHNDAWVLLDGGSSLPAYKLFTRRIIFAEGFGELWKLENNGSFLEVWAFPVPTEYL